MGAGKYDFTKPEFQQLKNVISTFSNDNTIILDQREISYGQGININASGNTLGALYSSTSIGCTSYIDCINLNKITITMPMLSTTATQGLVFYDSNFNPIDYGFVLRPKGSNNGMLEITITNEDIPVDAAYFRTSYWNFTNSLLYGDFKCTLEYKKGVLSLTKKRPYQSKLIHFSVKVNQTPSNVWDTTNNNQEPESFKASTGVLMLPSNYSNKGKKTKLIMYAHGMSRAVTYRLWGKPDDVDGDNATFLAQKQAWADAGYAIFDCNGPCDNAGLAVYGIGSPQAIEAYNKCYEYIIEYYNIDPEIYVVGGSMGGVVGINYCFNKPHIKALALLSPWTDLLSLGWNSLSQTERNAYVNFYGFTNNTTMEPSKIKGSNPYSLIRDISGTNQISYIKHPIKMWIGSLESGTSLYTYAVNFITALINGDSNTKLRTVTGIGHELVGGGSEVVNQEVITWFNKY